MANLDGAIAAIKDSRPPATDRFTYLTIVESHLSPEILPTLHEILQDAQLTQDIGWDLVDMLISLPGCEPCLETIARLGNPREVILKVLEVLGGLHEDEGYQSDDERESSTSPSGPEAGGSATLTGRFVTLLGMLTILHRRIKTKHPSRFVASTLQAVYRTYRPNREMTAAVVTLVHGLSGQQRPPLPTRKSSIHAGQAANQSHGDASGDAPDPEADAAEREEDPTLQQRLLLSFVTCVLEVYINGNDMAWAPRLVEYYNPTRIVPGQQTALQAFREEEELLVRDAVVGQLAALTQDLGLTSCTPEFVKQLVESPMRNDPLEETTEGTATTPADITLSSGGSVCLLAYWVFAATVFEADTPRPDGIHIFPEHFALLDQLLEDNAQLQIHSTPGTAEALVALGLWLEENKLISPPAKVDEGGGGANPSPPADFMTYHHLLTLMAVYHPSLPARNAAAQLAGAILHADPSQDDRLRILEDLLENCMFAQLKACAVTWLREEIVYASSSSTSGGVFAGADALEAVQYALFPNLADALGGLDGAALRDFWASNAPFVLQAVNFALFLWAGENAGARRAQVVPAGMDAAVGERWVRPLWVAADTLERDDLEGAAEGGPAGMELEVLRERLRRLATTDGFAGLGFGDS